MDIYRQGGFILGEVIVITSGKGGVGKTTTTANLATGLALAGKKVAALDLDIGLRNLDIVLGLENKIVYDLVDVVRGNCDYNKALIKDKRYEGLYLLPSSQIKDKTSVSPEEIKQLCNVLRKQFDYILIDCPAGIEQGFKNAIAGADKSIIVSTPEVSSVRDSDRVIGLLEAEGKTDNMLIINRYNVKLVNNRDMLSAEDVNDILMLDLIGIVPDDEGIIKSSNKGEPIISDNKLFISKIYQNIVRRIMGEDVDFISPEEEKLSIIGKLKRLLEINPLKKGRNYVTNNKQA
ncbi:MAG: septum site-determining protein MinD [Candidatus Petromonas sp.]|jgi:septum site-determining protein MinD|nr:septum site-determining protein MinD [Candidatus Petromonas sp.]